MVLFSSHPLARFFNILAALCICFGLVSSLVPTTTFDWSIVYPIRYNLVILSDTRVCYRAHHFVKACKTCFLVPAIQCCGCYALDRCIRAVQFVDLYCALFTLVLCFFCEVVAATVAAVVPCGQYKDAKNILINKFF